MTAHEEQRQRVVAVDHQILVRRRDERPFRPQLTAHARLAVAARKLAAQVIRDAPQCHVVQPASRIRRNALRGPLRRGGDERFLQRVLRRVEIAVLPRDRAEHLRRECAQQALDLARLAHTSAGGGACITWRTSIGMFSGTPPGPGAADAVAAISCARSGRSTSTIQ